MKPHPLCLEYPRPTPAEIADIEADMAKNGYDVRFPVWTYEGQILDGLTRDTIALKLGLKPYYAPFDGTPEEAKNFVIRANEFRRHLNLEWLEKKRQERIERVVGARAQGQSTRRIAENEGVSQTQVLRDLETATETYGSVDPPNGQITGKDGRARTASPTAPDPLLCTRCKRDKRVGNTMLRACPDCAILRGEKVEKGDAYEMTPKELAKAERAAELAGEATRDSIGNEVPRSLRDVFGSTLLVDFMEQVKAFRTIIRSSQNTLPYLCDKVFFDLCEAMLVKVEFARPWVVCRECTGKGCRNCRTAGYLNRSLFEENKQYGEAS